MKVKFSSINARMNPVFDEEQMPCYVVNKKTSEVVLAIRASARCPEERFHGVRYTDPWMSFDDYLKFDDYEIFVGHLAMDVIATN